MVTGSSFAVGDTIGGAAAALAIDLSEVQLGQLVEYVDLLERWSRVYNLTAIRDRAEIVRLHIVDCLAVLPALRHWVPVAPTRRMADIGSGAGLPGLVIAIAEPGWPIVCVEPVGKKAAFIRQAAASLGLSNASVVAARVEDVTDEPLFGTVISRAFASLSEFVATAGGVLAPGGQWVAMKSKVASDELAALRSEGHLFHVERLLIPDRRSERSLVWIARDDESERTLTLSRAS